MLHHQLITSLGSKKISYVPAIVAHYKMEEESGNAIDSRNGNTLTQAGTCPSIVGKIGNARSSNGYNNYFQSSANTFNVRQLAMSFWYKSTGADVIESVVGRIHLNGSLGYMVYRYQGANSYRLAFDTGSSGTTIQSTTTFSDNVWKHVFIGNRLTSGANEKRIYVNGVLENQTTGSSNGDSTQQFGVFTGAGYRAQSSSIDDLVFFDLSATPYTWQQLEDLFIKPAYNNGLGKSFGP